MNKKIDDTHVLEPWLNFRRKRFWVIVLVLVYTLVGFFVVPWVARQQLVDGLQSYLELPVELREVRVNPWALTVDADGFAIDESGGTRIIGFEQLHINIGVSSLFRWALVFQEVRLTHPFLHLTRHADESLNIDPLMAVLDKSSDTDAGSEDTGGGLPRLLITKLAIVDGVVDTRDEVPVTPIATSLAPINIEINDLTTLPDRAGRQTVSVLTPRGTRLEWSGTIELEPLISEGRVSGSGPYLPLLYQYFQEQINFELTEGVAELAFDYRLSIDPQTGLAVELSNIETILQGTAMLIPDADGNKSRFVSLPKIHMTGGSIAWPAQTVAIDAIVVTDAEVMLWRDAGGGLNIAQLLAEPAETEESAEVASDDNAEESLPWDIRLGAFGIDNLTVDFADRALADVGVVGIRSLSLDVADITNQPEQSSAVKLTFALDGGGNVALSGNVTLLPAPVMSADLSVTDLALGIVQPWLAEFAQVEIDAGVLDVNAALSLDADEAFGVTGGLAVRDLDISDTLHDERLLGWKSVAVDRLKFSSPAMALEISQIAVDAPYVQLRIARDQTTNFQTLIVAEAADAPVAESTSDDPASGDASSAKADDGGALEVTIGEIVVAGGSVDFSDLSLPLPFAVRITELEGNVTALATRSSEPTRLDLSGAVGEFGLAEVDGRFLPSDPAMLTDIGVRFRNIGMASLSPYTVKFAGREIADGRISLDLGYVIEDSRLQGSNNIVIDELTLGEKIDHPEAVDLPLGLAVALLKGPDGKIDLDLPVSGNVDDPEFSVGGVIFKAFSNLILKIVASPFNLLGRLVGMDSEDFDTIEFRPGEAALAPPEREKLVKLAEALDQRPTLRLKLVGIADPVADAAAIRRARVEDMIDAQLQAGEDTQADTTMLTERRRKVVEALVRDSSAPPDLAAIRDEHQRLVDPAKPEGRQELDGPAYTAALEQWLIDAQSVNDTELQDLAAARASAVQEAVMSGVPLDPARFVIDEPSTASLNESGWVPMKLEVSTN